MTIPIQNIYYLLVYAWNSLEEAALLDVEIEDGTTVLDLFARVLKSGLDHLLRIGLDRNYVVEKEAIAGIKGKIDISTSIKLNSFLQGRAVCDVDELSHDVTHNRILKTTIHRLFSASNIDANVKEELITIYRRLNQIRELYISDQIFNSVQLHRNIRFYRFLLDVCHLIHHYLLVDEATGEAKFRDFIREEREMRSVFEKFVRNFFRHEQTAFRVSQDRIRWQRTTGSEESLQYLPMMMTDVSLKGALRQIVIDTKFYPEALQTHHGKLSVRSAHLYQLFTYVINLASLGRDNEKVEGILLYPAVSKHLDLSYRMHGYDMRVCTINLNDPWRKIHENLMALIASPATNN
jgi:5-methylcytosine-specific restriction enzyme subunit McrC